MESWIGSKNKSKPYVKLYSIDNETIKNFKFKLLEGRFAENKNEIVISNHMKTNGGIELKIGDTVKFDIGRRETIEGYEQKRK